MHLSEVCSAPDSDGPIIGLIIIIIDMITRANKDTNRFAAVAAAAAAKNV